MIIKKTKKTLITKIIEGKTSLYVPTASLTENIPPKTPAFFNPQAKLNRDISMSVYRVFTKNMISPIIMADTLAGIGARGVRVALEVPKVDQVIINDGNVYGVKLAKKSASINQVSDKCKFSNLDVCRFLVSHSAPKKRFSIIDLDPFGSPAPFIDCALRAIDNNGLISITATDMAVLCGVYPKASYRKYNGFSMRTEYSHELGIRLLFGSAAHNAMRLGLGIKPIFSYRTRHYFRAYMTVHFGEGWKEKTFNEIGCILHCFKCNYRTVENNGNKECPSCKTIMKSAGPLWIGTIYNEKFLIDLIEDFNKHSLNKGINIAKTSLEEINMQPTYFVIDNISSRIGVATPNLSSVITNLEKEGFSASRSALNPKGIKTNASSEIIEKIVLKISKS